MLVNKLIPFFYFSYVNIVSFVLLYFHNTLRFQCIFLYPILWSLYFLFLLEINVNKFAPIFIFFLHFLLLYTICSSIVLYFLLNISNILFLFTVFICWMKWIIYKQIQHPSSTHTKSSSDKMRGCTFWANKDSAPCVV